MSLIDERKWSVYIHTTPSNKKYIGITSKSPKARWKNGNGYRNNNHFTNAIKKYGWDNIAHEVVANNLTEKEAMDMEKRFIKEYDTMNPDKGYNRTSGGEVGKKLSPELIEAQRRLAKKMWENEDFKKKMSELSKSRVGDKNPNYGNHKLAGKNNPNYGKKMSDKTKKKIKDSKKNLSDETRRKLSIAAKSRMTPEFKEYLRQIHIGMKHSTESRKKMSVSQKNRWTPELRKEFGEKFIGEKNPNYGKHMSEESKKILREKLSSENSVWFGKKHTEEEKKKMHDSSPLKKPVIQLDLNGKYLNEYSSYTYAAKAVNGKESSISECCRGHAASAYGYLWVNKDEYDKNKTYKKNKPKHTKEVVQLDENKEVINTFDTVALAAKSIDRKPQNLGHACKTGYKCGGYYWMYMSDYKLKGE